MGKESLISITDESGDKKYFTQSPNIVFDDNSSAIDQALYMQIKKFAGESGKCFATEETLCKKLKIGRRTFWKSRDYLLKKGWIKFEGMKGGKTRPIKSYSMVDIWKENILYYEKISAEKHISFRGEISVENEKDKCSLAHKISVQKHIEEEPLLIRTIKEETATTSVADTEIQTLIELFKNVNPSYKQFFSNKTERACLTRMLEEHGRERVTELIEVLPKTNNMAFAPVITSPFRLERKLGDLLAFIGKEKLKLNVPLVAKIR